MTTIRVLAVLVCLNALLGPSHADAPEVPSHQAIQMKTKAAARPHPLYTKHPFYYLRQVRIADADLAQSVWELRTDPADKAIGLPAPDDVFKSLSAPALKEWVSELPKGSHILSFSFLGPITSEMDLKKSLLLPPSLQLEVDEFRHFCRRNGVSYSFLISGG